MWCRHIWLFKVSNLGQPLVENVAYPMFPRPGSIKVIYPRFGGTFNFCWKKSENALLYFSFACWLMLSRLSCKNVSSKLLFYVLKDVQYADWLRDQRCRQKWVSRCRWSWHWCMPPVWQEFQHQPIQKSSSVIFKSQSLAILCALWKIPERKP